jgi:hypothetical protein
MPHSKSSQLALVLVLPPDLEQRLEALTGQAHRGDHLERREVVARIALERGLQVLQEELRSLQVY